VETFKDLSADKVYSILEGKGIVPAEAIRPKEFPATAAEQKR
jgi:hypothetical protein